MVYQTVRSDLLALESLDLLVKAKAGNAYRFIAPADLRGKIERLAAKPALSEG